MAGGEKSKASERLGDDTAAAAELAVRSGPVPCVSCLVRRCGARRAGGLPRAAAPRRQGSCSHANPRGAARPRAAPPQARAAGWRLGLMPPFLLVTVAAAHIRHLALRSAPIARHAEASFGSIQAVGPGTPQQHPCSVLFTHAGRAQPRAEPPPRDAPTAALRSILLMRALSPAFGPVAISTSALEAGHQCRLLTTATTKRRVAVGVAIKSLISPCKAARTEASHHGSAAPPSRRS